jgi:integrase
VRLRPPLDPFRLAHFHASPIRHWTFGSSPVLCIRQLVRWQTNSAGTASMTGKARNSVAYNDLAVSKKARAQVGKQIEWQIETVPGLSLVVKPSGVATFYVRYHVGQGSKIKHRRKALGQYGDKPHQMSLSDARDAALEIRGAVRKGSDPVREATVSSSSLTLRQLFDERVKKDGKRAQRTLDDYKLALEADVFPDLGDLPASEIDADQIVAVLERVEARSKHAAHKVRSALGSTFRWGLQRRKVKRNPVSGLGFNYSGPARKVVLSDDDLAALWKAIDDTAFGATEPMRIILKLAVLTGQRNSEVAGAERSELRLEGANPRWTIPANRMKRKTDDQIVPLSQQAAALFSRAIELAGDSPFVFPGSTHGRREGCEWRAEHIGQESVSRAMAKAREVAGIEDIRVHDMRKCLTTWLAERFERPDVLDRILHHARKGVTGTHYDFSVLEGPMRQALQRWADHVSASTRQGGVGGNVHQLKRA